MLRYQSCFNRACQRNTIAYSDEKWVSGIFILYTNIQRLHKHYMRTIYKTEAHNTFGGVASLSMGNPNSARQHSHTSSLPKNLTDDSCQHSDLLMRTSRSREPVKLRADFGMRTQPCAVTTSRDSFYDNVDCLLDVTSQRACASSEPYITRQAHARPKIGPVKRGNEMTLL